MNKPIIFFLFLLASVVSTYSQPRLRIKRDINIGTVYLSDTPKTYKIKYTNIGDKPLHIYRHVADCPCTTILHCDTILKPKQKGYLLVKFDFSGFFPMEIEKLVLLDCDGSGSTIEVKFLGQLKKKNHK